MTPMTRRSRLFVAMSLAVFAMTSGLAHAHSQLLSSNPADGANLVEPPASVVLTFNEALIADVDSVSINDEMGNVVSSQSIEPDGAVLSVPWPAGLPTGIYQVAYRVVSGDGHPVVGAISFTIAGTKATAAASTVPTSPASPTLEAIPSTQSITEGPPFSIGPWASGIMFAALALAVGARWLRRRRKE